MHTLSDDEISLLVYWTCNGFRRRHPDMSFDDLVEEAWIAALDAKRRFDPTKGAKLSTWIVTTIIGTLKTFISTEISRTSKLSYTADELEIVDKSDVESDVDLKLYLELMQSVLSPKAFALVSLQMRNSPRLNRKELSDSLRLSSRDIDNLHVEIKGTIECFRALI